MRHFEPNHTSMRTIYKLSALVLFCAFIAPTTLFAQGNQQQGPQWWLTNSLKHNNLPEGTLFHAQGEYSLYHSTGQVYATIHKGAPQFFIRNGRLQLSAFGSISYQKLQVGSNPESKTEVFQANPKVIYDIIPAVQWEGGILWERNDAQFLDKRAAYYTGLIYNNMEHKSLGKLYFLALGYQDVKSTNLPQGLGVVEEQKPIFYGQQTFVFKTIPRVNFTESLVFIRELDSAGAYRVDLTLRAMYQLTPKINGMILYQYKFEDSPLIPELAPFYEKQNTALTFGIRFSY
jgi:hypothetical protein